MKITQIREQRIAFLLRMNWFDLSDVLSDGVFAFLQA